jgi:GNAT superfamily N-acetyltransferase
MTESVGKRGYISLGLLWVRLLVGILEFRAKDHVSLFFIHPDWQGKGLGRKLWTYALEELQKIYPPIHWIGVNSSPYAVPIYEKLGFTDQRAHPGERGGDISGDGVGIIDGI